MVETHPEKRIIGYARVNKAHNLRARNLAAALGSLNRSSFPAASNQVVRAVASRRRKASEFLPAQLVRRQPRNWKEHRPELCNRLVLETE
jgi:hypothetical protein